MEGIIKDEVDIEQKYREEVLPFDWGDFSEKFRKNQSAEVVFDKIAIRLFSMVETSVTTNAPLSDVDYGKYVLKANDIESEALYQSLASSANATNYAEKKQQSLARINGLDKEAVEAMFTEMLINRESAKKIAAPRELLILLVNTYELQGDYYRLTDCPRDAINAYVQALFNEQGKVQLMGFDEYGGLKDISKFANSAENLGRLYYKIYLVSGINWEQGFEALAMSAACYEIAYQHHNDKDHQFQTSYYAGMMYHKLVWLLRGDKESVEFAQKSLALYNNALELRPLN